MITPTDRYATITRGPYSGLVAMVLWKDATTELYSVALGDRVVRVLGNDLTTAPTPPPKACPELKTVLPREEKRQPRLPHRIGPASMYDDGEGEAFGLILFCLLTVAGSCKVFDSGYTTFGYLLLIGGPVLTVLGFRSLFKRS